MITRKHAVLRQWCEKVDRNPDQIELSAGVAFTPGRQPEQADDYPGNAQQLYDVGVRLLTTGIEANDEAWPDGVAKVRSLLAWRDQVNAG